ncbi:MAG TPA: biotin--[acetyl-CoA-carboxylase] ligase [Acidimicrobiales bacterium]|nr:biotin--[acetyl-CoA-carboxylase] ligase [Acidimicrobiales bacterium]
MNIEERVRAALATETRFGDIRLLDETQSTNDLLIGLAGQGAPEGVVIAADFQSAGRGRLDRTWEARPGDGLLVSVLLRPSLPPDRHPLVSSAVALAARAACADVAGVEPDLKWPNDLLVGGAKLAGILAVAAGGAVVVGMGLNVHGGPPGAAHLDALAGRRVDRALLLEAWLRELDGRAADWDAVASDYRDQCATVGQEVSVEMSGGALLRGRAEEINGAGQLLVRERDGAIHTVSVGDVTHLRW